MVALYLQNCSASCINVEQESCIFLSSSPSPSPSLAQSSRHQEQRWLSSLSNPISIDRKIQTRQHCY